LIGILKIAEVAHINWLIFSMVQVS
jgi:hypothetical protein